MREIAVFGSRCGGPARPPLLSNQQKQMSKARHVYGTTWPTCTMVQERCEFAATRSQQPPRRCQGGTRSSVPAAKCAARPNTYRKDKNGSHQHGLCCSARGLAGTMPLHLKLFKAQARLGSNQSRIVTSVSEVRHLEIEQGMPTTARDAPQYILHQVGTTQGATDSKRERRTTKQLRANRPRWPITVAGLTRARKLACDKHLRKARSTR